MSITPGLSRITCALLRVLVSRSGFEMLQRFAAMIASSDDAIISNTIEGTVTSWNNGAERIFGYTAHEMLGQSISRPGQCERRRRYG